MAKLKDTKFFIDKETDSFVSLSVPDPSNYAESYDLKLADCNRRISWYFSIRTPKDRRTSIRKLGKVKDLIDKMYAELLDV